MGLRSRILRVVHPESGGPRKRTVLEGLARGRDNFARTFELMLERGELVMRGDRKGAVYGLPKIRPVGGNKRRRAHVPPASTHALARS